MRTDPTLTDAERGLVKAVRAEHRPTYAHWDTIVEECGHTLCAALSAFLTERARPTPLKWEAPPNIVYPKLNGFTIEELMKMAAAEAPPEPGAPGDDARMLAGITDESSREFYIKTLADRANENEALRARVEALEGALVDAVADAHSHHGMTHLAHDSRREAPRYAAGPMKRCERKVCREAAALLRGGKDGRV